MLRHIKLCHRLAATSGFRDVKWEEICASWNQQNKVYIFLSSYVNYNKHSFSFHEGPVSVRTSIFILYDKTEITSMNIKMDDGSPRSCHFGNALSFLFLSSCWISGNDESTLHIDIYMVSLFTFSLLWARKTQYQEKLLSRLAAWGRTITGCGWYNKITIDSGYLWGEGRDEHEDRWKHEVFTCAHLFVILYNVHALYKIILYLLNI